MFTGMYCGDLRLRTGTSGGGSPASSSGFSFGSPPSPRHYSQLRLPGFAVTSIDCHVWISTLGHSSAVYNNQATFHSSTPTYASCLAHSFFQRYVLLSSIDAGCPNSPTQQRPFTSWTCHSVTNSFSGSSPPMRHKSRPRNRRPSILGTISLRKPGCKIFPRN